jgi:RHS repeat-associated protein
LTRRKNRVENVGHSLLGRRRAWALGSAIRAKSFIVALSTQRSRLASIHRLSRKLARWFTNLSLSPLAYDVSVSKVFIVTNSYYKTGGQPVALRVEGGPDAEENGVFYLLRDHLGSASVTVKEDTDALTQYAELRYKPWGEDRPASEAFNETQSPSNRRFTGQRAHDELGLYYYKARWYDPALGRFVQPDSIVPDFGNPLDWDRCSYARNNPIRYMDPSGHVAVCGSTSEESCEDGIFEDILVTTWIMKLEWDKLPSKHQERLRNLGFNQNPAIMDHLFIFNSTPMLTYRPLGEEYELESDSPEALALFFKYAVVPLLDFMDTYEGAINVGRPVYKQTRRVIPTGAIEAIINAALQGYDDWDHPLSLDQRAGRMFVVGTETYATDFLSSFAGSGAAYVGGGSIGYGVTAYGVSLGLDHFWANIVNPRFFPAIGFGYYP